MQQMQGRRFLGCTVCDSPCHSSMVCVCVCLRACVRSHVLLGVLDVSSCARARLQISVYFASLLLSGLHFTVHVCVSFCIYMCVFSVFFAHGESS